MAKAVLEHPVREIHGALERKGIINRMKKYRSEDGRIIHEGVQESSAPWSINPSKPINPPNTGRLVPNFAQNAKYICIYQNLFVILQRQVKSVK